MPKQKIAIILFPGTNCEVESARVCEKAGMNAEIIRWNSKRNFDEFSGFVLPGGFSYEDRIRAGVIAAKDSVMKKIRIQAGKRKPVIGICNGAQILVESGLIPGLKNEIEMALAPNVNNFINGYFCTWVYLKVLSRNADGNAFTNAFSHGEVFPIPIAHGEGRFVSRDKSLVEKIKKNNQIAFQYCDKEGNLIEDFPVNPNCSMLNIAGLTNPQGNVLAIMPHPERASFLRQIPDTLWKDFGNAESNAPAFKIFKSMKNYIEEKL